MTISPTLGECQHPPITRTLTEAKYAQALMVNCGSATLRQVGELPSIYATSVRFRQNVLNTRFIGAWKEFGAGQPQR